ncbi:hypothetical protein PIROE2DRAFT_59527 [Piromyces sp. E2]|nr:hypothetical protein PIROE2DRAFT_59527 [Piromyces sp. E2]|eukprot:OUM66209.1 hypothetical protein PIROE2DRAFT_59527 [Piromyces sp. E2]
MNENRCFKLENSNYCPNFNGHYVIKRKEFNDTKEFDKYLRKYFESKDDYKKFLVDNFNCTNQNLPDFRYGRSFICNTFIHFPYIKTEGNTSFCGPQIEKDNTANTIPFCYSSCSGAVDSIEEIVKDINNGCSQAAVQARIPGFKTGCRGDKMDALQCIIGMGDEINYCGYNNKEEKDKYCQQNKAITDDCCSEHYNYKADDYIYSKEKSNSHGHSSKLPTVLFVLTLIASAVVTILLYMYRQKKKKENYRKLKENNGNEGEGDTSYTVKSSENNLLYVFHEYIPKINDEIQLNVGDIVKVTKIFDDGWAYGTNISTDCEGALPLACCTEYRTSISSMMMSYTAPPLGPVNHRESSLFT